jgi:release factor glutamine methyltransferase
VLAHPEVTLSEAQSAAYDALVQRRVAREPLAYILGRREFYGREFALDHSVLIPRPETELLVELALADGGRRGRPAARVVDVGTGCGALAVTLAAELPAAHVVAVDVSPPALAWVGANASRYGVETRVLPVRGSLLTAVSPGLDLIVANLPYLPSALVDTLEPEVAWFEPRLALDGGPDGTALNRRLLAQAAIRLAPGGLLLAEIDPAQAAELGREARRCFPSAHVSVERDLAGWDRVLRVQCP